MKIRNDSQSTTASALIAVIITITILCLLAGSFVVNVNNRRMTFNQASAWQEALVAAEAGVHQGIAQLEQGLAQDSLPLAGPSPIAWSSPFPSGTVTSKPTMVYLNHAGEGPSGPSNSYAKYKLTLNKYTPPTGAPAEPYYCIVSEGTVGLPGGKSLSMDSADAVLRKLNLNPQTGSRTATRTIEAWLRPVYTTQSPLKTDQRIDLNNHNIFVDSFNSADPNRSVNGAPDARDSNGHLLTNIGQFDAPNFNVPLSANIATNSPLAAIGNASVYGDVLTNGGATDGSGATVTNISNVKGQIINDYYEPIEPVYAPQWDSLSYTSGMLVSTGNGKAPPKLNRVVTSSPVAPITGGSKSNPTRIQVDSIKLNGAGDQIIFAPGTVDPDGYSYVELYVMGDFSAAGGGTSAGAVIIQPNVKVTMYVAGNLDFSGNGLINNNNLASAFSIYGISPPDGTPQSFTLAGNSDFYGTVYAPGADLKFAGGGSSGEFVGSFTGKSAFLNGTTQIRYDEALAGSGRISSFKIAAWFEDVKKTGTFTGQLQF
jgi:hypothetical protein